MINIRNSLFETNSSSSHMFILPPGNTQKIPKEIKLSKLMNVDYITSDKPTVEEKLAFMYHLADENCTTLEYLNYLRSKGINVINDINPNSHEYDSYMFGNFMNQSDLEQFLFNPDAEYSFSADWEKLKEYPGDYRIVKIRE